MHPAPTSADVKRGAFVISTDPARFDLALIHGFLTHTYWARGIDEETVRRAVANSLCFGVFQGQRQIGFARLVTDRATFAYLADVFILNPFRGRGLAHWVIKVILAHPDVQRLRRWLLATRDAHGLYLQLGFKALATPASFMERYDADVYGNPALTAPAPSAGSTGPIGETP